MKNIKEGLLEIVIIDGSPVVMKWLGRSEERDPSSFLNPYFDGLVAELKGKKVRIQFKELEYMNSSSVPPLIQLMKLLDSNDIPTVISYDTESKWQKASFKALETIARVLKNVEIVGE